MSKFASTVVSAPHHPSPLRATSLDRDIQYPDCLAFCVTFYVKRVFSGCRILTACPSVTPFGLTLGPTHPGRINLPQEPLGFRRLRFSRSFSLLIPTFSLPPRPAHFSMDLHPTAERSPTTIPPCGGTIHSFGGMLEPRSLSAQNRSTGELLRTL